MESNNQNNTQTTTANESAENSAVFARLEQIARAAKDINSFSEYKPGEATNEYLNALKDARENLAFGLSKCQTEKQKEDLLSKFDQYKNKLLSYYLDYYKNEASCPSVLISGPANFPTKKKAAQNSRRDSLMEEYKRLESLKDSLRGGYSMAISSDDPQAVEALTAKLEKLKAAHQLKIDANAYYRKNKTLRGFVGLKPETIEKLETDMMPGNRYYGRAAALPFESYTLTNENAEIKRIEQRIEEMQRKKENTLKGWNFDGGRVEVDDENNRIGVYFDERKNGAALDDLYKQNGDGYAIPRLLWSPRFQRWQCQNNAHNLRRLLNSKTYAPNDEESKNAVNAENERRKQAAAEEQKAKEEANAKTAERFKERAADLQEKQNELKKTGFILKPGMLAHVNNNLSEYMKAGHGIRRIIEAGDNKIIEVEISYNHQWNDYKQPKYLLVEICEAMRTKDATISGSEFMHCYIKLRDVPEAEKRQLKTLKGYAEQYKPETDDARILALYQAWKDKKIPTIRKLGYLDGTLLHSESAAEFLKAWKPTSAEIDKEEPKEEPAEQQQPQTATPGAVEEPKQQEPAASVYMSFKAEQISLF